ncbi:uncharacterized protein LOC144488721, partial [Mustelus asterias]
MTLGVRLGISMGTHIPGYSFIFISSLSSLAHCSFRPCQLPVAMPSLTTTTPPLQFGIKALLIHLWEFALERIDHVRSSSQPRGGAVRRLPDQARLAGGARAAVDGGILEGQQRDGCRDIGGHAARWLPGCWRASSAVDAGILADTQRGGCRDAGGALGGRLFARENRIALPVGERLSGEAAACGPGRWSSSLRGNPAPEMPVNVENILSELETFDLRVEDEGVPEKLLEHCITYRLKEEDIVNEWFAFSTTRRGIALNTDNVEIFEHEILSKRTNKTRPATVRQNNRAPMQDLNTLEELVQAETEEENLLDSYATPAKAGSQKRVLTTPEQPQSKKVSLSHSPRLLFSPASFSPSATPSQKYSSRGNRGEVVASFGTAQGASWRGMGGRTASVQLLLAPEDCITKRFKYMFQKLRDVRDGNYPLAAAFLSSCSNSDTAGEPW